MTDLLVTGGSGYIGSQVVWSLAQRTVGGNGYGRIVSMDRRVAPAWWRLEEMKHHHVKHVVHDLREKCDFQVLFGGGQPRQLDVVHLAGESSVSKCETDGTGGLLDNVVATESLLKSLFDSDQVVRRFVFASTMMVYAPKDHSLMCGELTPARNLDSDVEYACQKLQCEEIVNRWSNSYGRHPFPALTLRMGNVVGTIDDVPFSVYRPGTLFGEIYHSVVNAKTFKRYGDGKDSRMYCGIRRVVELICKALLDDAVYGLAMPILNVGDSVHTVNSILDEVRLLDRDFRVENAQGRPWEPRAHYASCRKLDMIAENAKVLGDGRRSRHLRDMVLHAISTRDWL